MLISQIHCHLLILLTYHFLNLKHNPQLKHPTNKLGCLLRELEIQTTCQLLLTSYFHLAAIGIIPDKISPLFYNLTLNVLIKPLLLSGNHLQVQAAMFTMSLLHHQVKYPPQLPLHQQVLHYLVLPRGHLIL